MISGVISSILLFTGNSLWPFSYFSLFVTTVTSAPASPAPLIPTLAPAAPLISFRSSLLWIVVMAPGLSVRIRMAPFASLPGTLLF